MNKTLQIYILFSLFIVLIIGGCRCKDEKKPCTEPSNPDCENYDPCYGKKPPSADFIIGQSSDQAYFGKEAYEFVTNDTMFAPFYWPITFLAKEEEAEYEWELGAETIEEKRFTRLFTNVGYGRYYATLTIRKEVDNSCFPEYTGTATKTKYFEVRPYYEFPIMGKYKVKFEDAEDSSIVQILPWEVESRTNHPNWLKNNMSENKLILLNFSNGMSNEADTANNLKFETQCLISGNKLYTLSSPVDHANIELKEGKYILAEYTLIYPVDGKNIYVPGVKFSGIKIE